MDMSFFRTQNQAGDMSDDNAVETDVDNADLGEKIDTAVNDTTQKVVNEMKLSNEHVTMIQGMPERIANAVKEVLFPLFAKPETPPAEEKNDTTKSEPDVIKYDGSTPLTQENGQPREQSKVPFWERRIFG